MCIIVLQNKSTACGTNNRLSVSSFYYILNFKEAYIVTKMINIAFKDLVLLLLPCHGDQHSKFGADIFKNILF